MLSEQLARRLGSSPENTSEGIPEGTPEGTPESEEAKRVELLARTDEVLKHMIGASKASRGFLDVLAEGMGTIQTGIAYGHPGLMELQRIQEAGPRIATFLKLTEEGRLNDPRDAMLVGQYLGIDPETMNMIVDATMKEREYELRKRGLGIQEMGTLGSTLGTLSRIEMEERKLPGELEYQEAVTEESRARREKIEMEKKEIDARIKELGRKAKDSPLAEPLFKEITKIKGKYADQRAKVLADPTIDEEEKDRIIARIDIYESRDLGALLDIYGTLLGEGVTEKAATRTVKGKAKEATKQKGFLNTSTDEDLVGKQERVRRGAFERRKRKWLGNIKKRIKNGRTKEEITKFMTDRGFTKEEAEEVYNDALREITKERRKQKEYDKWLKEKAHKGSIRAVWK